MTEASSSELEQKIDALHKQHAELGEKLEKLENDPLVDHLEIQQLKKEKLSIKDSITNFEQQLHS